MKTISTTLLAFLLLFTLPAALADMYVDRSIVIFEAGGQPREDVKVSNTGEEVMYIQVEVLEVKAPGSDAEERIKAADPREQKLIATPQKLVIQPGGQKLIRLVNLQKENQTERIYRINVTPIVPPLEEETSQLRIVVAYQILTIIQPDEPVATLGASREGKQLKLSNSGNSNILLSEGKQCDPADASICEDLPSRRLYAGNEWTLDLPWDGPAAYSVRTFDGIKKEIFP
ncbi:MAG: fimbria/pilus periplasmic chaperone [Pseudomonadales bacterium]|nr:fimbria/pilus periplasmic chaperone [Pseudomonadales bacterium]